MDHRLKKNSQFNFIYKKGERVYTDNFTLFAVKSKFEIYKIGFSVSKKLGKANKRNLLKRRLREIVKNLDVPNHFNYVLMAKENSTSLEFDSLKKEVYKIFDRFKAKVLKWNNRQPQQNITAIL